MMISIIRLFFATVIVFFFISPVAYGGNNSEMEKELVVYLKKIQKLSTDYRQDGLLEKENQAFRKKLLDFVKMPSSLSSKYTELKKFMYISTSKDGEVRAYTWDTELGGTMHFFDTVYQFMGKNGKIYTESEERGKNDPGGILTGIFDVNTEKGKVYLLRSTAILGSSLDYESIRVVEIAENSLQDKKLIKTESGLTSSIGFEYDFFSIDDSGERPIRLIKYDTATKTIKIPVVVSSQKFPYGRVTDRFISYKFNGTFFVRQG
ncbi:hypothetical protein HFU75_14155 [Acidithiobacillus sp. VAN18-2]|uniref:hypothetical protein n=1 Tax=Igneacidithiobacillus copahuensis TaxID=2724909 RepID=UPI001C072D3F|nr:hypothetical protein [Igneacidithiobacillus copahuensis]MBU2797881.1 hypothetical protein [Acidithiobacillus sp. VAN18-2]